LQTGEYPHTPWAKTTTPKEQKGAERMPELIEERMGQQVELATTDGITVDTDFGVLDAYDGRVLRLRKAEGELLYFPLHNVHTIAGEATNARSSPPPMRRTGRRGATCWASWWDTKSISFPIPIMRA
jgi:hypothetical protein